MTNDHKQTAPTHDTAASGKLSAAPDQAAPAEFASLSDLQMAVEDPVSEHLSPAVIMRLQQTHGNRFAARLVEKSLQRKPTLTAAPNSAIQRDGYIDLDSEMSVKGEVGLPGAVKKNAQLMDAPSGTGTVKKTFPVATNVIFHELKDHPKWYYVNVPFGQQQDPTAKIDRGKEVKTQEPEAKKEDGNVSALKGFVAKGSMDTGDLGFKKVKTPLFKKGPDKQDLIEARDVQQGKLGDCYLLSSLAAIAMKNPNQIKQIVTDQGDTVIVRFYRPTANPPRSGADFAPEYVTVNKTVVVEFKLFGDEEQYASSAALWPAMIEKAYAAWGKHHPGNLPDGYGKSFPGIASGSMADAWQDLTGQPAQEQKIPGNPENISVISSMSAEDRAEKIGKGTGFYAPWDPGLSQGFQQHTVVAGDTLKNIAAKYGGMNPEDIRTQNTERLGRMKAEGEALKSLQDQIKVLREISVDASLADANVKKLTIKVDMEQVLQTRIAGLSADDSKKWLAYYKGNKDTVDTLIQQYSHADPDDSESIMTGITDLRLAAILATNAALSAEGIKAFKDHAKGYLEVHPNSGDTSLYSKVSQDMFVQILRGLKARKLIGIGTKEWGEGDGNAGENTDKVTGLASNHAYMVVNTVPSPQNVETKGVKLDTATNAEILAVLQNPANGWTRWEVALRNPWGRFGRVTDKSGKTTETEQPLVRLEIVELRRYAEHIDFIDNRGGDL